MKKNGFTLAEVLITLAIIGVVATLTLPALMTNTQEQQAKSTLKKGINTLTEAAQMNQAIEGFDYSSLMVTSTTDQDTQSLYGLLTKRTNVDYQKSGTGKQISYQGSASNSNSGNYTVFFRDGSTLSFPEDADSMNQKGGANAPDEVMTDGLPYGIPALFDTNGTKAPNILSNCEQKSKGAAKDNTSDDLDKACSKDRRVIKDQFGVRLRAGYAVPNGAAARWAFEN